MKRKEIPDASIKKRMFPAGMFAVAIEDASGASKKAKKDGATYVRVTGHVQDVYSKSPGFPTACMFWMHVDIPRGAIANATVFSGTVGFFGALPSYSPFIKYTLDISHQDSGGKGERPVAVFRLVGAQLDGLVSHPEFQRGVITSSALVARMGKPELLDRINYVVKQQPVITGEGRICSLEKQTGAHWLYLLLRRTFFPFVYFNMWVCGHWIPEDLWLHATVDNLREIENAVNNKGVTGILALAVSGNALVRKANGGLDTIARALGVRQADAVTKEQCMHWLWLQNALKYWPDIPPDDAPPLPEPTFKYPDPHQGFLAMFPPRSSSVAARTIEVVDFPNWVDAQTGATLLNVPHSCIPLVVQALVETPGTRHKQVVVPRRTSGALRDALKEYAGIPELESPKAGVFIMAYAHRASEEDLASLYRRGVGKTIVLVGDRDTGDTVFSALCNFNPCFSVAELPERRVANAPTIAVLPREQFVPSPYRQSPQLKVSEHVFVTTSRTTQDMYGGTTDSSKGVAGENARVFFPDTGRALQINTHGLLKLLDGNAQFSTERTPKMRWGDAMALGARSLFTDYVGAIVPAHVETVHLLLGNETTYEHIYLCAQIATKAVIVYGSRTDFENAGTRRLERKDRHVLSRIESFYL